MADPQQLDILRQGVDVWNAWRKEHPDIQPDLSGADLHNMDLHHARLSFTSLNNADLSNANLDHAYFVRADLSHAQLESALLTHTHLDRASCIGTNFNNATLTNAYLRGVRCERAIVTGADLSATNLQRASFFGAEFWQTNLRAATLGYTSLVDVTLSTVQALETVVHTGPSHLDLHTLARSQEHFPIAFVRKAGVPEEFIEYIHSHSSTPMTHSTCFLAYASQDQAFIERILADLRARDILCLALPYDQSDAEMNQRVLAAIEVYDLFLPVFSQYTRASSHHMITNSIKEALAKEQMESSTLLYPLQLDQTVAETKTGWARFLRGAQRTRDFTYWRDEDAYQVAFQPLLRRIHDVPGYRKSAG